MNSIPIAPGDRKGSTFVVVMGMTLLATLAAASILSSVLFQMRQVDKQVCLEQAFYIAAAGAERAASHVADGDESSTTLTGSLGAGNYAVTVVSQRDSNGELLFNVTSCGTVKDVSHTVTLRGIRRVSWAKYALWYNSEATKLWIVPGERFDGRVYSRPQFHFHDQNLATKGQVRFTDSARSAASSIEKASSAVAPIFEAGLTLNAEVESMSSIDFSDLLAKASANGLVLEGATSITLDGATMKITNSRAGWTNHSEPIPNNGMVYVKTVTVTTTGTGRHPTTTTVTYTGDVNVAAPNGLNGRLTIVADDDINIKDHVRYAHNPQTDPTSTDALGLIAKQDVVVDTSAPNNVEIYAHMIAQNGGFGVKNYNSGASRGTLNIYGGIVNSIRNPVGIVGGSGYLKNYVFDKRFSKTPPPNYPKLVDELEWTEWDG